MASRRREALLHHLAASLSRPANVVPAVALVAAGIATGLWPLYLAGAAVYGVMVGTSVFDKEEAQRTLAWVNSRRDAAESAASRPASLRDPAVLARYEQAHAEYDAITEALRKSPLELSEVKVETAGLMDDVAELCNRAQGVTDYLETVDEARLLRDRDNAARDLAAASADLAPTFRETVSALDQQIGTITDLRAVLTTFDARMGQLVSSLGAIRGEIARLEVASQADEPLRVLEHVTSARELVTGITERMREPGAPGQSPG